MIWFNIYKIFQNLTPLAEKTVFFGWKYFDAKQVFFIKKMPHGGKLGIGGRMMSCY